MTFDMQKPKSPYKLLTYKGCLVGAIGLEPTTPTMSRYPPYGAGQQACAL